MSWLLFASFLKRGFGAIWTWLSHRSFWQLVCMALAGYAILQHFQLADARHDRDSWKRQFTSERAGREADRKAYTDAQKAAAEKNRQQIQQIENKQKAITDEVTSDLQSRLERIRRELRNPAPQGAPRSPGAGGTGETPCRAYDPSWMCVSPEERLRAAEDEERHDQLITWVEKQSQVR